MANQRIAACLWFDNNAEEAVNFYQSVFPDTAILGIARYGQNMPGKAGTVMTISFTLHGQQFLALNGGPVFTFNEAVSFVVNCETQAEIDLYWEQLLKDGGQEVECGWLKDRFGLSWQIVPTLLQEMVTDPDQERSENVMHALLKMKKLNLEELKNAFYNVKIN